MAVYTILVLALGLVPLALVLCLLWLLDVAKASHAVASWIEQRSYPQRRKS